MNLNSILSQINASKPLAEENLEEGPTNTLSARRGRKAAAREKLKTLREEYIQYLTRNSVFIVVTGSNRNAFASAATESFGCFAADAEGFYKDLATRVAPALYLGKTTVANMFDVLGRHLEDKALEMHVREYPQLIFKAKYQRPIASEKEFLELVKEAVNDQIGGELAGVHAVRYITDEAIAKNHDSKITPILLVTGDDKLAVDLLPALERINSRVFMVVAGKGTKNTKAVEDAINLKDATADDVEKALTKIKGSLKK